MFVEFKTQPHQFEIPVHKGRTLFLIERIVFTALTLFTRLTLPYMGWGARIINISSIASFVATPRMAVYSSTKAYVTSLSLALREELRLENRLGRASMRPEDVKPGLHREPFSRPEHLMVFVSGSGSGQTQLYFTTSGSTAGLAEGIGQSRPWMTKVIHGAALTKYGR